jgi:hypothetical protein
LLARVTRGEPWHPHAPFRKHKRLGNGRVGGHCIQGNGSTAGVTNKVHGSIAQLLDKRDEVGDMFIEAELTVAAPWLWIVVA